MKRNAEYYLSRGFDPAAAAYFAGGRRKILSVTANPDFTLTLGFDNGEIRVYDAKPLLQPGTVFAPFARYENFSRVYLDEDHCVAWDIDPAADSGRVWSNKVDLSPDTCYLESVPAGDGFPLSYTRER